MGLSQSEIESILPHETYIVALCSTSDAFGLGKVLSHRVRFPGRAAFLWAPVVLAVSVGQGQLPLTPLRKKGLGPSPHR